MTAGGGCNVPSGTGTLSGGAYTATTALNGGLATFTIAPGTLSKGANTLTATYSGDSNFMGTSATTSITVSPVAINVPPQNDLQPGAGFTTSVALSAGSTYSGTMNLTCTLTSSPSGAQKLPTCSLSPTSVTLASGGNGTSALTVSTTAAATASLARPFGGNMWGLGGGGTVLAAAVLMLGIPSRRRRWFPMLVLLCVIAAAGIIACGGGGGSSTTLPPITPGTTRGNYTFTLTGTDSANTTITTSTIVQITVL